jgi:hypothetical protein
MHRNTTPATAEEAINPAEEAALRRVVASTTVACPATAIQTAVTTAAMVYEQDWSQEARLLLREFNLPAYPAAPAMYAAR